MFGGISVTILKSKISDNGFTKEKLNVRQLKAILFVKENGRITNKDYQKLNKISRETATRDLKILVDLEILYAMGSKGAGSFYQLK